MKRTLFSPISQLITLFFLCFTPLWSLTHASTIEDVEFQSIILGRTWHYNVYLPTNYQTSNEKYPVLYLLHGNDGSRHDWVVKGQIQKTVDDLIDMGLIPSTIIIMPDAGTSWFVDLKEKMESAFLHDLIPQVQTRFRTITQRNGRVIAGLSMGGYGVMRFVLKYPEHFQAAALLSPAIYNPEPPLNSSARTVNVFGSPTFNPSIWKAYNYPVLWDGFMQKKLKVPIYITSGDDDEFYVEKEAVDFYELLRKNQQPAELRITDGKHSWSVWKSSIGDALTYIFKTVSPPQKP